MVLQLDKLGKSVKDLINKKYDFTGLTIKTTNASSGNVSVESTGNLTGAVTGSSKLTWSEEKVKAVVELSTADCDKATSAEVTLNKVAPGVDVTIASNAVPVASVKAVWSNANAASTFKVARNMADDSTAISLAATVGKDAVTLGGDVTYDLTDVSDYNLGLQYDNSDLTATVLCKKQLSQLHASFFKKGIKNTQVGVAVQYDLKKGSHGATLGLQRELDANTTIKTRLALSGAVATVVEHRLADPRLTIALASNYDASSGRLVSKGMGLNLQWA